MINMKMTLIVVALWLGACRSESKYKMIADDVNPIVARLKPVASKILTLDGAQLKNATDATAQPTSPELLARALDAATLCNDARKLVRSFGSLSGSDAAVQQLRGDALTFDTSLPNYCRGDTDRYAVLNCAENCREILGQVADSLSALSANANHDGIKIDTLR